MLDAEAYTRTLQQVFELFVEPEVKRRHEAGEIAKLPFAITSVQVILPGSGGPAVVRLNQEVKAAGVFTVKPEKAAPGMAIDLDDILGWETIYPSDVDDQDAGHITVLWFGQQCFFSFDFRYNKRLAFELLNASRQFLESARRAKNETKSWSVFVDNLYSALELAVKAFLWTTPWGQDFKAKMAHAAIRSAFAKFPVAPNAMKSSADTLEALNEERKTARYLHKQIMPRWDHGEVWLRDAEDMLNRADAQAASPALNQPVHSPDDTPKQES